MLPLSWAKRGPHKQIRRTVPWNFVYAFLVCFFFGQRLKGSLYRRKLPGVVFAKGCEFLLLSLGKGFGVGFRGWWGAVSCGKKRENGEGVSGGVGGGQAKEPASQCASFVETTLWQTTV